MDKITEFRGEYSFLSNFYMRPVTYKGLTYRCVESAFQAQKDPDRSHEFVNIPPNKAKRLGRQVYLRPDWEYIKISIMRDLVYLKFKQHVDLQEKLLATGNAELIEGNDWHDNFWGDCICPRCQHKKGKNHLGKLLMETRARLRNTRHASGA